MYRGAKEALVDRLLVLAQKARLFGKYRSGQARIFARGGVTLTFIDEDALAYDDFVRSLIKQNREWSEKFSEKYITLVFANSGGHHKRIRGGNGR